MSRPQKPGHAGTSYATERVVGLSAVRAVLELRPRDVLNLAHAREARVELGELLRLAAKHRIAYRELAQAELDRLADTVHHEGVCALTRPKPSTTLREMLKSLGKVGFVLALDGVDNPHNVGAILRSAAFFGARGLLVGVRDAKSPDERGLTPAMVRIAEGGAERVPVLFTRELTAALAAFADEGVTVIGADGAAQTSLHELRPEARCVVVLGSERSGMSESVRKRCTKQVRIAGTGHIESLNVSVAAGILMVSLTGAQGRQP